MDIDFTPVRNAKLGPEDLRRLCDVGRLACSHWLNGHHKPHHLLEGRVAKVVDGIQLALEAGLLPVPFHIMRRERAFYIKNAIEQAQADQAS